MTNPNCYREIFDSLADAYAFFEHTRTSGKANRSRYVNAHADRPVALGNRYSVLVWRVVG